MMKHLKQQWNLFIVALTFYTRIPYPYIVDIKIFNLSQASHYLPLIGLVIGAISSLTFYLLHLYSSILISLFFSMLISIILTGAFHEDALADFSDAFCGGWTQGDILRIMKDSRLGTYGVLSLIIILTGKYLFLNEMTASGIILAYCIAHPLSRFVAVSFIYSHDYISSPGKSKSNLNNRFTLSQLLFAFLYGIIAIIYILDYHYLLIFIPLIFIRMYFSHLFNKKLNAYTGDCLGAVQQVSELAIYLSIVVIR